MYRLFIRNDKLIDMVSTISARNSTPPYHANLVLYESFKNSNKVYLELVLVTNIRKLE